MSSYSEVCKAAARNRLWLLLSLVFCLVLMLCHGREASAAGGDPGVSAVSEAAAHTRLDHTQSSSTADTATIACSCGSFTT